MSANEIRKNYPLSVNVLDNLRRVAGREPNMTDADNPDIAEMLAKGFYRQVKQPETNSKQSVVVRFEPIVLNALRKQGRNWQIQLNDHLKGWLLKSAVL